MHFLRLACFTALALSLCGFAKKDKLVVRFYVESIGAAGGSFTHKVQLKNPPREASVESVPFVSERNIKAIYPVENADGSLGCAFKLDTSGTMSLQQTSTDRRGSSMLVMMATKKGKHQVIDMIIDKPIRDGIIYVPTGITPGEMAMLRKEYAVIGAPEKKR